MKVFLFNQLATIFAVVFCTCSFSVEAQQQEYRITAQGAYEYLSNPLEVGMIYDESNGSYYKAITERTFFLEAQDRGYITAGVTYAQFVALPLVLQIAAVNQPLTEVIDCSTNFTSPKCLRFVDIVLILPDSNAVLVVPLLSVSKLPLTQLQKAKLFLRQAQ